MTYFEQQRTALINARFAHLRDQLKANAGVRKGKALKQIAADLTGTTINLPVPKGHAAKSKTIKVSYERLRKLYKEWETNGCKASAVSRKFKPTNSRCHPNFIAHVRLLATDQTGAASKHGVNSLTYCVDQILRSWRALNPIPGIGIGPDGKPDGNPATAPEWFAAAHPQHQAPDWEAFKRGEIDVDFPFSRKTIERHAKAVGLEGRKLGNRDQAANEHGYYIERDYSTLRPGELYTLDDVRLDLIVTHDTTGKSVKVVAYIMMDVASRFIPGFMCKPESEITQNDVAELIVHSLTTAGIGSDYATHILLERGTAALGHQGDFDPHKIGIEAASDNRIKIHRTGMNEGIRLAGTHRDAGSGNARGKSVIESFNRRLHNALRHLPGQRGHKYDMQPASLGFTGDGKNAPGTIARAAQQLATFQVKYTDPNHRLQLHLPLLRFSQLLMALRAAIKEHNDAKGRQYQGHRTHTQIETAPGIWQPETLN